MTPEEIIKKTLVHEGGWSDHPNDRGGKTNWGITLKTLQSFVPSATEVTLRTFTKEQAIDFYKQHYFYGMGVDKYPQGIWDIMFDMNVNHGLRNSTRILQRAIERLGGSVTVDGIPGPRTQASSASFDIPKLRNALIEARSTFFKAIVANNPSQQVFLKGWLRRAESFRR